MIFIIWGGTVGICTYFVVGNHVSGHSVTPTILLVIEYRHSKSLLRGHTIEVQDQYLSRATSAKQDFLQSGKVSKVEKRSDVPRKCD